MKRLFIQGDRSPNPEQTIAATKIGQLLSQAGWEANVGGFGGLVRIMNELGVNCHAHVMKRPAQQEDFSDSAYKSATTTDTRAFNVPLATAGLIEDNEDISWGARLSLVMARSDAFLFFAGKQGTMAHIVPALAHIIKGKSEKKLVVIGWPTEQVEALEILGLWNEKCQAYDLDQVEATVEFLTS